MRQGAKAPCPWGSKHRRPRNQMRLIGRRAQEQARGGVRTGSYTVSQRGDVPPPLATSFTTALETTSTQQHRRKARAMVRERGAKFATAVGQGKELSASLLELQSVLMIEGHPIGRSGSFGSRSCLHARIAHGGHCRRNLNTNGSAEGCPRKHWAGGDDSLPSRPTFTRDV